MRENTKITDSQVLLRSIAGTTTSGTACATGIGGFTDVLRSLPGALRRSDTCVATFHWIRNDDYDWAR